MATSRMASAGNTAGGETPTTASEVLVREQSTPLPSGWAPLLAGLPGGAGERLRSVSAERLLPALQERARSVDQLVRRRQWVEVGEQTADLHRLSLHLIDRLALAVPPAAPSRLNAALRVEVLIQSLEECCKGENRGRARAYARQIVRLLDEIATGRISERRPVEYGMPEPRDTPEGTPK